MIKASNSDKYLMQEKIIKLCKFLAFFSEHFRINRIRLYQKYQHSPDNFRRHWSRPKAMNNIVITENNRYIENEGGKQKRQRSAYDVLVENPPHVYAHRLHGNFMLEYIHQHK